MRQTPYYVFDTDEFAKRAAMIRAALDCKGGRRIPLCFSIKANPFLLHRLPGGLDHVEVCSPGELEICIALGVQPESIIYSGVMKEKCDIERAVSYGAGILTCESIRHATLISQVMFEGMPEGAHEAEFTEKKAQVILRLTSKPYEVVKFKSRGDVFTVSRIQFLAVGKVLVDGYYTTTYNEDHSILYFKKNNLVPSSERRNCE